MHLRLQLRTFRNHFTAVFGTSDQRLQQLFSVIKSEENSRLAVDSERAKNFHLYLQASNPVLDVKVLTLIQGGTPSPDPSPANQSAKNTTDQPAK